MRRHFAVSLFCILFTVASAEAKEISVQQNPQARHQLDNFLKWVLRSNKQENGTFYIAHLLFKNNCRPFKTSEGRVYINESCQQKPVFILWSEGNQLFQPVFVSDAMAASSTADRDINLSVPPHNFINLQKDVVPREEDIAGSTYLMNRDWVFQKMREALNGDRVMVNN